MIGMKNQKSQDPTSFVRTLEDVIPYFGPIAPELLEQYKKDCITLCELVKEEIKTKHLHQKYDVVRELISAIEFMLYPWPIRNANEPLDPITLEMCQLLFDLNIMVSWDEKNSNFPVPIIMNRYYQNYLTIRLSFLKANIGKKDYEEDVSELFQNIYGSYLNAEKPVSHYTWHDRFNRIALHIKYLENETTGSNLSSLILHLVSTNINHHEVAAYIGSWIDSHLKGTSTLIEKLEQLYFIEMIMEQCIIVTKRKLVEQNRDLQEYVLSYISSSIKHLQKLETHRAFPFADLFHGHLKINMSVKQLGILIKAAIGTGLISTDNISALLEHVVQHVSTKQSDHTSVKALMNALYQNSDKDIDAVDHSMDAIKIFIEKLRGLG